MHFDIDWQEVDTVLLDMDGTLLDLAFDNHFWQNWCRRPTASSRGSPRQKHRNSYASNIPPYNIR